MSNFKYWHDHVADMPAIEDGKWVDLEDGIAYNPSYDYIGKTKSQTYNKKKKTSNLKGSSKQNAWAEKIRSTFMTQVSSHQAQILNNFVVTKYSKFWIENRNLSAKEMGIKAEKASQLIDEINHLLSVAEESLIYNEKRIVVDSTKYDEIMKKRNDLIDILNTIFKFKFC